MLMLIVFMILALFYLEINSVAAGKKSKSVEKFGGGIHVRFSKLKLTKFRPRTKTIYWRSLMCKISFKRMYIYHLINAIVKVIIKVIVKVMQ
jgi:multisubunit Na+/H+ antiporter MnhE subunit